MKLLINKWWNKVQQNQEDPRKEPDHLLSKDRNQIWWVFECILMGWGNLNVNMFSTVCPSVPSEWNKNWTNMTSGFSNTYNLMTWNRFDIRFQCQLLTLTFSTHCYIHILNYFQPRHIRLTMIFVKIPKLIDVFLDYKALVFPVDWHHPF